MVRFKWFIFKEVEFETALMLEEVLNPIVDSATGILPVKLQFVAECAELEVAK